ncbi:hypothetical protein LCGC14_1188580 [marine sediment metagenome]|uniref:Uncharacterized protein n=1 Tax=marine sediment metagenome TaxID=412755 RepID=A0A0F9LK63_9ZZZZ
MAVFETTGITRDDLELLKRILKLFTENSKNDGLAILSDTIYSLLEKEDKCTKTYL